MTIVTPIDGQPAQAEHVAQLTESLTGVRAEPITLRGDLARTGADLSNRLIKWQTNGADRWRMGIIDAQAEGAPDTGGDFKFQYVWNSGTAYDLYRIDRDVGALVFNAQNSGVVFEANGTTYPLIVRSQGDTWPAFQVQYDGRLEWGTGGAATDTYLGRSGAGTLQVGATLFPGNTATNDLGTTTSRWRKLWAAAGEFTATPTVGGTALPTFTTADARYLPLTGGSVMTGALGPTVTNTNDLGTTALKWRSAYLGTVLSVAGASATANQATFAITTDAQPRLIIDGNGKHSWGPGASTAQDTTLERVGAGLLRAETSLGIGGTPPVAHTARRGLLIGDAAYIMGGTAYNGAEYRVNSYQDTSNVARAIIAGAAGSLALVNDSLTYANAPSVGAGASQTMTARLAINASGNVALTPAAGTAAVSIGGTAQPKISVQSGAPASPMTGDLWMW